MPSRARRAALRPARRCRRRSPPGRISRPYTLERLADAMLYEDARLRFHPAAPGAPVAATMAPTFTPRDRMENPLLGEQPLPQFLQIRPEHVEPAVREVLTQNRARLEALASLPLPTFATLIEPLEELQHRIARTWSPVSHLNAVLNADALRSGYNACLPLLSAYQTDLAQSEPLFIAYRTVADQEGGALAPVQRQVIEHALRDFRLAGVGLPAARKERFKSAMLELSQLQAKFEENVLDASNAWTRHVEDPQQLRGLNDMLIEQARRRAHERGVAGWVLALDQPTYVAVLTDAESESLRRAFYEAWMTRASDCGPSAGRPVWHPDVRFFEIADSAGEAVGSFYLDAYARPHKRAGAWMDECVGRKRLTSGAALPVAYLVCNFLPPGAGRPALLTHDDVLTLFHEFGHGLHHLLTRVDYPSLAGINGVAWDAVELPSQFLENYAWHPEVLQRISGHFEGDAQLPRGALDDAAAGIRPVRFPHPHRVFPRARRACAADPARGAGRGRGRAGAGVEPLPEQLRPHFRRRVRRRLLRLQVGGGAGGGRLCRVRGKRGVRPRDRPALPRRDPQPRRQPRRPRGVHRVSRPPAGRGRAAEAARHCCAGRARRVRRKLTARALPAPLLLLCVLAAPAARAETLYVIEQLVVGLSGAPDGSGERITSVKSGDALA